MKKNNLFRRDMYVMALFLVFFVASFMAINTYLEKTVVITLLPSVLGQEIQDPLATALEEFYQTQTSDSNVHLMWLGKHKIGSMDGFASAGYLIKTSENIILIDSASLLDKNIANIEKIDVILVTHTHGDHFIPESTVNLQKKTGP